MGNPFFDQEFISPSLNRVCILELPGVGLPDDVRGKNGYALLSAASLATRVQAQSAALELGLEETDLLHRFDDCFTAVSPTIRSISEDIAEVYGRSLGYLLLTLKRGDPANQAARPAWDERHWSFWTGINTVWVGGGLVSGHLGSIAVREARRVLVDAGFPDYTVKLSPHGADLPLVGLSRLAPVNESAMLLFDFGQTAVKRAIAEYKVGELTQLKSLPPLSSPCESLYHTGTSRDDVMAFEGRVLSIIEETWREMERPLTATIGVSLACYLRDGQPPPSEMGCYGRLQLLSDNLQSYLAGQLSQHLGQDIHLHLCHDGTAAALACGGGKETAVIMLGTAVGIGFPDQDIQH